MCGFSVSKEKIENKISHRGIKEFNVKNDYWHINFNSLPLSSYKKGIEQPFNYQNLKVVFNGEIFNYKRLNKYSSCDTDYLFSLFKKHKGDIYKIYKESLKWDGFWSICIIENDCLYFFTDPLGKKTIVL